MFAITNSADITRLLWEAGHGNLVAEEQLLQLTYSDLRRIAGRVMRLQRPNHTLQPSALLNEAYIHLFRRTRRFSRNYQYMSRIHFFGVAARVMKQVLVDHARSHNAQKRGGCAQELSFEDVTLLTSGEPSEFFGVHEVINRLAEQDQRLSSIVEMKFFLGLNETEIAQILRVTPRTVQREWRVARDWLHGQLSKPPKTNAPVAETGRSAVRDSLFVGCTIRSRYELSEKISTGEYSAVYIAKDKQRGMKPVAVKVFSDISGKGASANALVKQELRARNALKHLQSGQVVDKGELSGGLPFIVTEFVPGKTLRDHIVPNGLPLDRAIGILRGICDALSIIHRAGVLHLDIKPENIILTPSQEDHHVTLIDFGSARVADSTEPWIAAGTGAYLAPEWINGTPSIRTDIFATGLVAFEMITGTLPGEQSDADDVIDTLRNRAPLKIATAIAKAVEFNEQHRFTSAEEFKASVIPSLL